MKQLRLGAFAVLGLGTLAWIPIQAQDAAQPKAAKEVLPEKATLDKPIKTYTLTDLMYEKKDDDKPGADKADLAKVLKDNKATVIFFMSEKCSVTWRYEKRFGNLMKSYAKKGVAFVGVRCSANDTEEGLRKFAESKNFVMPLLNDSKGELTSYFRITNTPTFAVLDKKGVLRYRGSFDNNADEADADKKFVPDAVAAVLAGKDVPVKANRPFG